jgi:hypothetical protein
MLRKLRILGRGYHTFARVAKVISPAHAGSRNYGSPPYEGGVARVFRVTGWFSKLQLKSERDTKHRGLSVCVADEITLALRGAKRNVGLRFTINSPSV